MAMRRQSGVVTTAPPPQSVRPVYEDFQPKFERKQEATEDIIQVHLPGFVKERIKITYVNSTRTLRIQGERPRQDNRWSRFNQTFPVPENYDADKIQGKFLSGILTITIPKKIVARVGPAAEDKTPKAAPSPPKSTPQPKLPEQIPPTSAASTSGVEKRMEEKIARPPSLKRATTEPKVEKGAEDIPTKAASTAINERQRVVERSQSQSPPGATATTEPKAQKGQHLAPPKAALTTDTQKLMDKTSMESSAAQVDQKSIRKKLDILIEGTGKAEETKELEKIVESKMVKGREIVEKIRDSVMSETTAPKIALTGKEKKERSSGVKEEQPKEDFISEKGTGLKNVMVSAKERVNDLAKRMNEDDRKMLINIGAAVVVLVALGAYVSYSYGSSGKSKN